MTTWRYSIPNEKYQGWAILFLDDAGCFACLSDYGNYTYRWNARGLGDARDLRDFIVTCDPEYILRKISQETVYDADRTLAAVQRAILEKRRWGGWSKERASSEWEAVKYCGYLSAEYQFQTWLEETSLKDAGELVRHTYPAGALSFMAHAWPRLKALIQSDLAAEIQGAQSAQGV